MTEYEHIPRKFRIEGSGPVGCCYSVYLDDIDISTYVQTVTVKISALEPNQISLILTPALHVEIPEEIMATLDYQQEKLSEGLLSDQRPD